MENYQNKNITLLLCIFGGLIGLHYFYIKDIKKGCLYLFTGGLFGIGWIIDIVKILVGNFDIIDNMKFKEDDKWRQIASNFYISQEYQKLKVNKQEIEFSTIIDIDLIEDEVSISKTTGNNKTKGKAKKHIAPIKGIVGGVILGPVGAVIGATSGKTDIKSKTKVNTKTVNIDYCTNLSLKITLNDINNPMVIYKFINVKTNKESYVYKNSYEKAQKCISLIQAIINNNKQVIQNIEE